MSEHIKKTMRILYLLIPFCYIAIGCILMTDLFASIDMGKRLVFGVIIVLYGIFRIYRAVFKTRETL